MMRLEWDEEKNETNIRKHGISFEVAARVFLKPYMEIWDEKHSGINQYGKMEDRFTAIGWVEDVLYVCYTVREHGNEEFIRMISARVAMPAEKELYFRWLRNRRS